MVVNIVPTQPKDVAYDVPELQSMPVLQRPLPFLCHQVLTGPKARFINVPRTEL